MLQCYFDGELSREVMADVSVHLAACLGCTRAMREIESENSVLFEALALEFAAAVPTERLRHRVDAAVAGLHVVRPSSVSGSNARAWLGSIAALFTVSPQRAFGYAGLAAVVLLAAIVGIVQFRHGSVAGQGTNAVATLTPRDSAPPTTNPQNNSPERPVAVQPTAHADGGSQNVVRRPTSRPVISSVAASQVKLLPGERSYLQQIASLDTSLHAADTQPMRPGLQVEYERNLQLVNRAIAATRNAAKSNPNDPDAAEFMFAAYQSKVDLLNQVADARLSNRPH
jgi:hypothetical protein